MLLGVSTPYMSDPGAILSGQCLRELLLRATQAQGGRVGGDAEHDSDLPGLELLPGPEAEHLPVGGEHAFECGLQVGVGLEIGGVGVMGNRLGADAGDKTQTAPVATPMVCQGPARDAVTPGESSLHRGIPDSPPHGEQHLGEQVLGVLGSRPSAQVPLQRLERLLGDALEALSVDLSGHA